ncbi:MAG: ethanolamine ammonia-lyase [Alcaligenaceae bacterium]|nr:MAG: ethanolamine ammonia-lyase [Alcaligenaceae bacterium]
MARRSLVLHDKAPVVSADKALISEATPAWLKLKELTGARIALGRTGVSLPTKDVLEFRMAHARARDAVHTALEIEPLFKALVGMGFAPVTVASQAVDRHTFLLRPDLGRRLSVDSAQTLTKLSNKSKRPLPSMAFVIADGLSAQAIEGHALALLEALRLELPQVQEAAVVLATQARVALGDEIGEILGAELMVVLIGERPGLSAPDSMSAYLTWQPKVGRTDVERNCISNIRLEGLSYGEASQKLAWLIKQAKVLGKSGVELKEESES